MDLRADHAAAHRNKVVAFAWGIAYALNCGERFNLWLPKTGKFDTPLVYIDGIIYIAPIAKFCFPVSKYSIRDTYQNYRHAGEFPDYASAASLAVTHMNIVRALGVPDSDRSVSVAYIRD